MTNTLMLVCMCLCLSLVACTDDSTVEISGEAGPFTAIELAEIVASTRAKYDMPGLSVLIRIGDEKPLVAFSGVRKLGNEALISESDLWFIGSTAKSMTATLLATYVQEAKVGFDTPLVEIFPDYAQYFTRDSKQITVSHVLSHAAGLAPNPANSPAELDKLLGDTIDPGEQRRKVLAKAVSEKLLFEPGTDYSYSNTGYILAGAIIERLGGKDYESLLAERVFHPLGITEFGFGHPAAGNTGQSIDQPWGHRPSFFRLVPVAPGDREQINPAVFNSAGNLYISLQDWAKFVRDQLQGQKGQGILLEQALYRSLQLPTGGKTGYSRGWGVLVENGVPVMLTHSGSDGSWYADVRAYPPTDMILLVVTNDGREDDEAKAAVADIRRHFNSRYSPAP